MSPVNPRERLAREAVRLHERYHLEVIERFGLCPWAKHARVGNRTRAHVVLDEPCLPNELAPVLEGWDTDESIDVAFVIAPRFGDGSEAFARWAASLTALLDDRFLSAPFHPGVDEAAGSVRFFRQAPDPTVQLVRRARLEEVRAQDPPHYKDIFTVNMRDLEADRAPKTVAASVIEHNERVLEREGRHALQAILDDIYADRDRTYAGLIPLLQ
ncbi:MAG: hypothetical protein O7F08_09010 [Deltaproteobacteria bacterium]|nr:hypothetical protein [Deltaproteobacteria bacterium]